MEELGKLTSETEMLRIWEVDKKSRKDFEELKNKKGFDINIDNGLKMKCMGFTEIRNKKTRQLLFAYKFKHETRSILYYFPSEDKKIRKLLELLKILSSELNYQLQNIDQSFKSIREELRIIKRNQNKK